MRIPVEKKQSGGARPGSGKKKLPSEKKKLQVTLYVAGEEIEKIGGMEKVREICYILINKELKKISKK